MDSSFSSLLCTNAISRTATQQTVCAVAIIHHSANGMSKYSTTWYLQVHKVDTRRRGSGGERKKRKREGEVASLIHETRVRTGVWIVGPEREKELGLGGA
jgi:hypothetical protein